MSAFFQETILKLFRSLISRVHQFFQYNQQRKRFAKRRRPRNVKLICLLESPFMSKLKIDAWIKAGYKLLGKEGVDGVKVERLARILQLNKSGFTTTSEA